MTACRYVIRIMLLSLSAASPVVSQLAPDGARLRMGVDTLGIYTVTGRDTVLIGLTTDALERTMMDGRMVIRRVYQSSSATMGSSLDTLIDDAVTLAPVRAGSRSAMGLAMIEYMSSRASGTYVMPNGDSIPVDVPLPDPVYSASTFDLVIRASPLAEGWRASIPAFVPASRAVVQMNARVEGIETVDGRQCWRVETEFIGMSVAFCVDTETRSICQQAMRPMPGVTILHRRLVPASGNRRVS